MVRCLSTRRPGQGTNLTDYDWRVPSYAMVLGLKSKEPKTWKVTGKQRILDGLSCLDIKTGACFY